MMIYLAANSDYNPKNFEHYLNLTNRKPSSYLKELEMEFNYNIERNKLLKEDFYIYYRIDFDIKDGQYINVKYKKVSIREVKKFLLLS